MVVIERLSDGYVRANGRVAKLVSARKDHRCSECPEPIEKGTCYYSVTLAGAGLGSIKFPDRVHMGCLQAYFDRMWEANDRFNPLYSGQQDELDRAPTEGKPHD